MDTAMQVLRFISEDYVLILAVAFILIGIYVKVRRFMSQSVEVKKQQLKDEVSNITSYIKVCLMELITNAEKKYGSGTGEIKKSEVYTELLKMIPSLEDYIIDGDIATDTLGELIDEAVEYMNELTESNKKIAKVFNKTTTTSRTTKTTTPKESSAE